jgi:hypothetical protein
MDSRLKSNRHRRKALGPLADSVRDILPRSAQSDSARAQSASALTGFARSRKRWRFAPPGPRPFSPPGGLPPHHMPPQPTPSLRSVVPRAVSAHGLAPSGARQARQRAPSATPQARLECSRSMPWRTERAKRARATVGSPRLARTASEASREAARASLSQRYPSEARISGSAAASAVRAFLR